MEEEKGCWGRVKGVMIGICSKCEKIHLAFLLSIDYEWVLDTVNANSRYRNYET